MANVIQDPDDMILISIQEILTVDQTSYIIANAGGIVTFKPYNSKST